MSRIRFPLDSGAVARADDRFYTKHPELIQDGQRIPIDPDTQPRLAEEWQALYLQEVPNKEAAHEKEKTSEDAIAPCADKPEGPDDYLHVFALVPGTTRPVNDLFDFMAEGQSANPSGRGYWDAALIDGVERLKKEADEANAGDRGYHSEKDFDFSWSGDNNQLERVKAGRQLADRFWGTYSGWRSKLVYFHLIGHSHGGNVINDFTDSIAGGDPKCRFGDRWFVKSITYLSTPFFQKIEQPKGARVHGSAAIYNVWNYFDLTQLTIADFSIEQASKGVLGQLRPRVAEIKKGLAAVNADIPRLLAALKEVAASRVSYQVEHAKNLVPFVNNDAAEATAKRRQQTAQSNLNHEAGVAKRDIDGLASSIDAMLDELSTMLTRVQTPANQAQVNELQEVLTQGKVRIATVGAGTQRMVDEAAAFEVRALLGTLLGLVLILLETVAGLLAQDRWLRVVAMAALHIIQMYDDTLQTNGHYGELAGFSNRARPVEPDDRYKGHGAYGKLRTELFPHESALHRRWASATTVASYARTKWSRFDDNAADLSVILKVLIAQVGAHFIRPYRDTVDNVRIWTGRARSWNEAADTWVPGYHGTANAALLTRIEAAVGTILATMDGLIEKDFHLFASGSPLDSGNPGTLGYLAINSHSVSRRVLFDDLRQGLVAGVNRG